MALEALKSDIKKFGKFDIVIMDDLRDKFPDKFVETGAMDYKWFEKEIRPFNFVYIRKDVNSISFTLQKGPVKEVGVNGCQVDTIVEAAKSILEGFNATFPCRENSMAITKLDECLMWLDKRTKDREARAVEGTSRV